MTKPRNTAPQCLPECRETCDCDGGMSYRCTNTRTKHAPACPNADKEKRKGSSMTKPKTPTLASLRVFARKKGYSVNGGSLFHVSALDTSHAFLEVLFGQPSEPTYEQALAMIRAALEVLPDVRGKK